MLRLDFGFRPSVATWTLVVLAYLCAIAHLLLGGHPLDADGSVGDHDATVALIGAVVAILGSVASAFVDALSARRANRAGGE